MDEHFIYIVLEIVSEIPKGNVATYKQKDLLIDEGVTFKPNGNVDLKACQWKI